LTGTLFEPKRFSAEAEQHIQAVLTQQGPQLLVLLFEALFISIPTEFIRQLSELLIPLAHRDPHALQQAVCTVFAKAEPPNLKPVDKERVMRRVVELVVKPELVFAERPGDIKRCWRT